MTDPVIRDAGRSGGVAYEVSFTGKSKAWKKWNVKAVYVLEKTSKGWRVHDIELAKEGSLRKVLACGEKAGAAKPNGG